jgi:TrmH family RNA methyltransferase
MSRITSRHSAVVQRYRAAAQRGADELLLDGAHLVADALAAGMRLHHAVVADAARQRTDVAGLVDRLVAAGVEVGSASSGAAEACSPVRTPTGIVALAARPAPASDEMFASEHALVVVACGVQDPGNMGALARVAEAAGATGLVAAGASADPFGWKALRGSMGSAFRLPIATAADAQPPLAAARRHRCHVLAAVPRGGEGLYGCDLRQPSVVLIGGEGRGLTDAMVAAADRRVAIPMVRPVESLNVTVSAAIILYEAVRQRGVRP